MNSTDVEHFDDNLWRLIAVGEPMNAETAGRA